MTGLVLLLGAGTGSGLWLILAGVLARPIPLETALAALTRDPDPPPPAAGTGGWAARAGRPAVRLLRRAGLPTGRARRDLAALGKPAEEHLAEQATATLAGLLLPVACTAVLAAAGIGLGVVIPAAAVLLCGMGGFVLPEAALRAEASRQRAAFRHALGSFLDLVVISLAGGAGVDQALDDAASIGRGSAYTEIRYALDHARLARTPPWDTLADLGERLGIEQLEQLAATVGLAGTEGAKVRASLTARAHALRTRQLADAEAQASAATERMSLPIVGLLAGFLLFIGTPAVAAVLEGF